MGMSTCTRRGRRARRKPTQREDSGEDQRVDGRGSSQGRRRRAAPNTCGRIAAPASRNKVITNNVEKNPMAIRPTQADRSRRRTDRGIKTQAAVRTGGADADPPAGR